MSLRLVSDAGAFVASALAAAKAQDRRYEREGTVISSRVPAADAHLCSFARIDADELAEISAKGGRSGRGE